MERVTFTFDGKRYYIKGKTKKEAAMKAALRQAELKAGAIAESSRTVNSWFDEYLATYKPNAGPRTLANWNSIYRNDIQPWVGALPLKSVKSVQIQRIMNNLSTKSLSHAKKVKILLTGLFQTAVDNDLLNKTPVKNITTPNVTDGSRRALTPDERKAFLKAAEADKHGLFFLVIYHCGLRPSEVARIRGEDVTGQSLHVRGTKTKAADRIVPIPDALKLPDCHGYMFLTQRGQIPGETARRNWWKSLARDLSDDLTPYCLRHDYCTRLQEAGVPIDVARRLMGHSSIEVTSRIYTHASEITLDAARELINKGHT